MLLCHRLLGRAVRAAREHRDERAVSASPQPVGPACVGRRARPGCAAGTAVCYVAVGSAAKSRQAGAACIQDWTSTPPPGDPTLARPCGRSSTSSTPSSGSTGAAASQAAPWKATPHMANLQVRRGPLAFAPPR